MSLDELEPLDDDFNPYAAPKARARPEPVGGDLSDAEEIRRAYLKHEASVKSVGALAVLGGLGVLAMAVFTLLMVTGALHGPRGERMIAPANPDARLGFYVGLGIAVALYFAAAVLFVAAGIGLHMLRSWARWTALALDILVLGFLLLVALVSAAGGNAGGGLFFLAIFAAIAGYVVYLLASAKTGEICTPEYREVIRLTPHIKYRTSIIVFILLLIVGLILITAFVAAILRSMR